MSDYHKKYKLIPGNKEIVNKRINDWKKTPKGRATSNRLRKEWTLSQKLKAIEYKGGKCLVCGYDKCAAALEFHHVNPLEKDSNDTGATRDCWTFERKKKELDKCVLLCCRCHREVHANLISL
jgi:5-methylcytosine-specific restriction endonuclease McrA